MDFLCTNDRQRAALDSQRGHCAHLLGDQRRGQRRGACLANQPPLVPRGSPLLTAAWTRGAKVRVIAVNWPEISRSGFQRLRIKELHAPRLSPPLSACTRACARCRGLRQAHRARTCRERCGPRVRVQHERTQPATGAQGRAAAGQASSASRQRHTATGQRLERALRVRHFAVRRTA